MIKYCPNCAFDLSKLVESPQEERSILDDYVVEKKIEEPKVQQPKKVEQQVELPKEYKGVEVAQPKVLDNAYRIAMLANRPIPMIKPVKLDGELDQFSYKGEKLFFGEGLQQSY